MATRTTVGAQGLIEVDATQVEVLLTKMAHATSPPSLQAFLLARASAWLRNATGTNFATETAPGGRAWAALRPATEEIREDGGYPPRHPINERDGEMKEWLTTSWGDASMTSNGAELVWPSKSTPLSEEKLRTAQMGSKRGDNPMFQNARTVPRPVIGLEAVDVAAVLGLLSDHLSMMLGGTSNIHDTLPAGL